MAYEASYECNDQQPCEQPGHCIFTGTVADGTSAARHGFPRSPLRTDPRCFPLSPTQSRPNIAQSNFCGSIPSAASTTLCHKRYSKAMKRWANLWLPAERTYFDPRSFPDNPCSGGKNSLFLSTGNSTANALSYGVSSQPPETQRAGICSNSLFFPGKQRICLRRPVRLRLPAQPTSHVLSAVSRLLSDTPEERTQFPSVIATALPTPPSLGLWLAVSGAHLPPSLRRPKTGWQFRRACAERPPASAN